ncbi:MAG: TonB C-terminal domain-containing protein [Zetaproteobacteria bacterium]|nr:MAG: TonB C-terminal domain-containing protein [Zetaproteobacteria bacterium]
MNATALPPSFPRWRRRDPLLLRALIASILLHLLLIAIIGLRHGHPPKEVRREPRIMDVVLFQQPKRQKRLRNDQARIIANQTVKGAAPKLHDTIDRIARAPQVTPRPQPPSPPRPLPAPRVPPLPTPRRRNKPAPKAEQRQPRLHRHKKAEPLPPPKPAPKPKPMLRPIPLAQLMPSALPFARRSPQRDRTRARHLPRREANIPINTREEKYASYAHALVDALEEQWRPGQADYADHPEQDRRVLLKLSIDRDGSLAAVEILRPSPIAALNDSAIRAIHDAAPFRPLPSAWGLDRASFFLTFEVVAGGFVFRGM